MEDHKDAIGHVLDGPRGQQSRRSKGYERDRGRRASESFTREKSSHIRYLSTSNVIKALEECVELAPLHNPPNLLGIAACQELMPDTPDGRRI